MHLPEMSDSISLVANLYVTGGKVRNSSSSQVDVVDVRSGQTCGGPSMRYPRRCHAAAASPTSLFVFSGVNNGTLNSCEIFNAQTRQ